MRKSPDTKQRRICDRTRRDRTQGKQNIKCFGGGRRSRSALLPPRRRRRPSSAMAASCASAGSAPSNRRGPDCSSGSTTVISSRTAAGDGVVRAARRSCMARENDGRGIPSAARDVPGRAVGGRDAGPLDPLVHVRVRCGRCSRVDGRVGMPSVKRGVLGLSISFSSGRTSGVGSAGAARERKSVGRVGALMGNRRAMERGRSSISGSGAVCEAPVACRSTSGSFDAPLRRKPPRRKSMVAGCVSSNYSQAKDVGRLWYGD